MAFNRETFRTRAITAIVFLVVMGIGMLWNRWSFFILFSAVHFGCWFEYKKLIGKIDSRYKAVNGFVFYVVMLAGWCLLIYFSNNNLTIAGIQLTRAALWCGAILLIIIPVLLFIKNTAAIVWNGAVTLGGIIYLSLSLGLLIAMRNRWTGVNEDLNLTIPLLTIFSLWINDTMAYIVGSFIGKTPLSHISPKKTWEGTIGGALLAVIIMSLIAWSTGRLPVVHALAISAIAAVTGTYGDLFESKLKRMAGVKDSGSFMPGHGGFLDRFDSLLFASTAVYIYVALLM
jgi:phosphatidate cytidylyltransferase